MSRTILTTTTLVLVTLGAAAAQAQPQPSMPKTPGIELIMPSGTFVPTGAQEGVGARSYNFRHADLATTHELAAYVSAGGELGLKRVRVRLEVRDYFTGVNQGTDARRNDLAVMAGLRLGLR